MVDEDYDVVQAANGEKGTGMVRELGCGRACHRQQAARTRRPMADRRALPGAAALKPGWGGHALCRRQQDRCPESVCASIGPFAKRAFFEELSSRDCRSRFKAPHVRLCVYRI